MIRLPGYPFFLAAIYSVFGHENNAAVRIVQSLIDTATCGLVALLAFLWQPDMRKKRASAFAAFALAAVCPFTTIYTATILTEVLTNFLLIALLVAVTLAFRNLTATDPGNKFKAAATWWLVAGLTGGIAVMMRPDTGLFLAAVGVTLLSAGLWPLVLGLRKTPKTQNPGPRTKTVAARSLLAATIFSLGFAFVLAPWTIRNWRVFHLFQPLAPAHAEMPGEFVPRGYMLWARTWIDSDSYIAPFLWTLDTEPIDIDDLPPTAFDSAAEKNRVAALFDKYNHPDDYDAAAEQPMQASPNAKPTPAPQEQTDEDSSDDESADSSEPSSVEMTPEIDAGFADVARERIARHPFRYYVWLPLKRARTMWFDTHSQYWPFEGTLLPLDDLDYDQHQQIWLPLFAGLTAFYTLLGLAGAWGLWRARQSEACRWLLLVVLAIGFRAALFSFLENPEPRYFVEFFPLLSVLGGIAIAQMTAAVKERLDQNIEPPTYSP